MAKHRSITDILNKQKDDYEKDATSAIIFTNVVIAFYMLIIFTNLYRTGVDMQVSYLIWLVFFLGGSILRLGSSSKKALNKLNLLENHYRVYANTMTIWFLGWLFGAMNLYFLLPNFSTIGEPLFGGIVFIVTKFQPFISVLKTIGIGFIFWLIATIIIDNLKAIKSIRSVTKEIDNSQSTEIINDVDDLSKIFKKRITNDLITIKFELVIMVIFVMLYLIAFSYKKNPDFALFKLGAIFTLFSVVTNIYLIYFQPSKLNLNILQSNDLFRFFGYFQIQRFSSFFCYINITYLIIAIYFKDIIFGIKNDFPWTLLITNSITLFAITPIKKYLSSHLTYFRENA